MKYNVSCLTGSKVVKCRMYHSLKTAVAGFSKSIIHFFGQSYITAIIFWCFTTFGFLPVLLYAPTPLIPAYFGSVILTRIFVSLVARQNVFVNLFLLIPQQLLLGVFIFNAIFDRKKTLWKGRHI